MIRMHDFALLDKELEYYYTCFNIGGISRSQNTRVETVTLFSPTFSRLCFFSLALLSAVISPEKS